MNDMATYMNRNFLIGPYEFQAILKDLTEGNSSGLLNMADVKSSQARGFNRKKKHLDRKSSIELMAKRKEKLNAMYLG